jgi:hypothetical protein
LVSTTVRCGFMIAHPAVLTWSRVTARRMARHALWEQRTLVKTFGPRGAGAPAGRRCPADVDRGAVGPAGVDPAAS